jgi:solute carrier family 39 (zinc transporter), member 1/2/3
MGEAEAKMELIQGLMSAISAGMLIYASCVEMLGGDFVFGSVGEGHGHGHGHGDGPGGDGTSRPHYEHHHGGEDAEGGGGDLERGEHDSGEQEHEHRGGDTLRDKVLAIGCLLAGVVAMGVL